MSTWISDEKGLWHPAKESVPLRNNSDKTIEIEQVSSDGQKYKKLIPPGGSYIYEGPDRAAMFQWWEENGRPSAEKMKESMDGDVTFGTNFRENDEFLKQYAKFREIFGFKDVEAYLKYIGYDSVKTHAKFLQNASVVNVHDAPAKINEIQRLGGGTDNANPGKNTRFGGFGDMPAV